MSMSYFFNSTFGSEQLAEAIERLLVDRNLKRHLAETALREVQTRFSVGEMAKQTERVYEEVLGS